MSASTNKWIRNINTENIPGMSTRHINRFFDALSQIDYIDTRPPELSQTLIWYNGDTLGRRHVVLHAETIDRLQVIAMIHRIPPRKIQNNALQELRPMHELTTQEYVQYIGQCDAMALATAVLEAIGLRYLEPASGAMPVAPAGLYSQPDRKRTKHHQQTILDRMNFV